ncbi:OLC1v1027346C2 [Oldenlandia corymbosa var. corymbosa]|nr:OLC1v1027346C2 [Oldenlandia corymbosa var. corymbosa]
MSDVCCDIDSSQIIEPVEFRSYESMEWSCLKREHKVYAFLARGLDSSVRNDCLLKAISASSTDNYPDESIQNTLTSNDRIGQRASYWSSKGESDATVPETLTYNLMAKMCLVTEIHIQPFKAYFQFGFPIYSAKSVRFLMGHSTCNMEPKSGRDESSSSQESPHEKYVWTYISPEFFMAQENRLQKFKLPKPVLCIGGILQVQLLGRVQRQEMDGLYYMCIAHVQVVGRPLSSAFDVEILDRSGKCKLRHLSEQHLHSCEKQSPQGEKLSPSSFHTFSARVRGWEQMILNTLFRDRAEELHDSDLDLDEDADYEI